MKRLIALLLSLLVLLSLAACGGSGASKPEQELPPLDPATPAQFLQADFRERVQAGDVGSMEELANELIANEVIPFAGAAMTVEPGYLNGFTDEITGFEKGAMFAPMIGSIPFVGYIFELESGSDADAFVQLLKDKADLRWNICTSADEMAVEAVDGTVFFVMSPASFEG